VRVQVDYPSGKIKPGMFVRTELILESRTDTVLISRDALVERDGDRTVFAVEDGRIKVREVQVGATRGSLIEILDGVEDGDRLVVTGQTALAEGQRVTAQDRAASSQE
jgi:hypothetical protein